MLIKPSIEQLLPKVDNRYILAMVTAKRARQLVAGAKPMVDSDTESHVTLACEELSTDQVKVIKGQPDYVVPLRPEIEAARLAAEMEAEAKRKEELLEENKRHLERTLAKEMAAEKEPISEEQQASKIMAEQLLRLVNESADFDQIDEGWADDESAGLADRADHAEREA